MGPKVTNQKTKSLKTPNPGTDSPLLASTPTTTPKPRAKYTPTSSPPNTKKNGKHSSDYRGTNHFDNDVSQRLFWGAKTMNTPEGAVFHPRMANQGITDKASSNFGCHIKYQKFIMCAMNLNQRAAVAQCRNEFRDYRDCQSDFTIGGNWSSKTYYQDLLKSVSRAQGDYWLDLTSRDYAKFASYSFEHRPNVGVNGNFQPGFMGSEKMGFDKYLGK